MPADNLDDIWGPLMQTAGEQLTPSKAGAPTAPERSSGLKVHETTMVFAGSTTLSEAVYNKMMQTMVVKFKRSQGAYSYQDVPASVAEQLFACESLGQSAGKFFIKEIKNVYACIKLNK